MSVEIPVLSGLSRFASKHNQSEARPRSGWRRVISMEFLHLSHKGHFAGKQTDLNVLKT